MLKIDSTDPRKRNFERNLVLPVYWIGNDTPVINKRSMYQITNSNRIKSKIIQKHFPEEFFGVVKDGVLFFFGKTQRKALVLNSLSKKVAGYGHVTLIKKRFQHRSFPANLRNFWEHFFYGALCWPTADIFIFFSFML